MGAPTGGLSATPIDLFGLRQAFETLAKGDAEPAKRLLAGDISWHARALRTVAEGTMLGRDGASRYLTAMATAIRSRGYRLEVLSVRAAGPDAVVTTAWTAPGGKREAGCATLVRFKAGQVQAVVEQA